MQPRIRPIKLKIIAVIFIDVLLFFTIVLVGYAFISVPARAEDVVCTDTAEPSQTFTPEPSITNTIEPSPPNTTEPSATNTVEPTVTNTIEPSPTNTIEPSPTNTTEPSATNTTEPVRRIHLIRAQPARSSRVQRVQTFHPPLPLRPGPALPQLVNRPTHRPARLSQAGHLLQPILRRRQPLLQQTFPLAQPVILSRISGK